MSTPSRASITIDDFEIQDPSPWLAEASRLVQSSSCIVRWISFRMAKPDSAPKPGQRGLFYRASANGYVAVRHFTADGVQVDVPMLTTAEQDLINEVDLCAALNLAALSSIDFWADPAHEAERKGRAAVFERV